jgi:hypothetical protein
MRLLGSRALFVAGEKQHQSYRNENGKRGTKHQMRQWGHSRLLAVIRGDPAPFVRQLDGTDSTKVRHAPHWRGFGAGVSGSLKNGVGALNRSAGKRVRRIEQLGGQPQILAAIRPS